MTRDSSSFERQLIDALKSIVRALGGSSSGSSYTTSSSPSSSSSNSNSIVTAINGVSSRLDGINSELRDIIVGE